MALCQAILSQQSNAWSSEIMRLIWVALATIKTKCPWNVQINLQDFSCYMWVAC